MDRDLIARLRAGTPQENEAADGLEAQEGKVVRMRGQLDDCVDRINEIDRDVAREIGRRAGGKRDNVMMVCFGAALLMLGFAVGIILVMNV